MKHNLLFYLSVPLFIILFTTFFSQPLQAQASKAGKASWLVSKTHSSIAYFVFQTPNEIKRFNFRSNRWMKNIPLNDVPTAFAVDNDGLYVAFGRSTYRYALDGTGEMHLENTNYDATDMLTRNNYLYIYFSSDIKSVDKFTGALIDQEDYWYSMKGLSLAPSMGKIFGRSTGVSPSDIVEVVLNSDGSLGSQNDSPYHGDYPGASNTYVFPGDGRVVDNAGIIYNTNNLTYNNSLAGSFDDLAFFGDLPVVLRGDTLYGYSNTMLETGTYKSDYAPSKIYIVGDLIYSFVEHTSGLRVQKIPVTELEMGNPGTPVDPNGLAYDPDKVLIDKNNVVKILSGANLSVFQWSIWQCQYMDTIPLLEAPSFMTYSAPLDCLYLSYPSGKITRMRAGLIERPFANSPQKPMGLATAGEFLFVCDPSGAWESHFTYSPNGALISQVDWNYYSKEYVWCEANRKIYFFRDGSSPNDLLWEDIDINGVIGNQMDSPYHSSAGIVNPIRVAPDGSVVLLGSGRVYDALTLVQLDTLSNDIDDAAWVNGTLFTMREFSTGTQLQKWTSTYGVADTEMVNGTPIRMFDITVGLLVMSSVGGVPTFSIYDEDFTQLY